MTNQSILITGASSGIGAALAKEYAQPGVFLALTGRNAERLQAVGRECESLGAQVTLKTLDICERETVESWIGEIDDAHPIDLLVANAGISSGTARADEKFDKVREIFAVNVDGVLNTVLPAIPRMQARRAGQIAIMSSVAGFRGLPGTSAYAAGKAAVKSWGEGLRGQLWANGIRVSVICPGYVVSAMTDTNQYPMPLIMPADKAARIIRRGLERNKSRIAFPWPMHFLVWLMQVLPISWTDPLFRKLPKNPD
ncbi:MAG: SDR family NAD(P)-dependent oxidoreductase [Rhodospirillales bacterium]|jgi:short-subunit dehydrogenase|nr:SDR family NAD(P)-dependent oxidoreductase [Rhodospirillales bacterium]